MKAELRKKLLMLGRHQQKRIWQNRIIARMPPLLWWSASIFFLGGSMHQLLPPLNPAIVVSIALLPSLMMIFWISASVKPTAEEGAADADRLLGANSLFVSSWELARSTATIEGISRLLLTRTETELPDWSQHIKKQPQRYMKPATLVASTLGLLGLLFLLLPTPHAQTSEIQSISISSQEKTIKQDSEQAMILSELFSQKPATDTVEKLLQQSTSSLPSKKISPQKPLQNKQAVFTESSEIEYDKKTIIEAPDKPRALDKELPSQETYPVRSAQPKSKKIADQTAGNETARSTNMEASKAEDFDNVSLIDVETGDDTLTTAFDDNHDGNELIVSASSQPTLRQPTNHHLLKVSQTASGTLLTAEQRTLVWRYFKQLEKNNETNQ